MYIHLGDDFVVSTRDIVGIFDFKAKMSPIVEEFLKKQKHKVVPSVNGTPKSIVVTVQNIYYSPLSSSTLKKRAQFMFEIDS
ncbi:DUF370 domain-containing protein [Bacillus subtilis]|uniref:extracellular matrix regulator RemB n=1 Tax=Bacillus subtilis TaxID=1423 RepID=UPI000FF8CD1A|nr:extracellular matrix regulator RemB [Bacillus subtilis]QAR60061.1 DUF370 domain-containing protein [Bacillus subtilis]